MRRFAKEKLKHWIRVILHTDDSPERTSFAFATGVFISFLPPVPYVHTILALIVAFVFRMNRIAVIVGAYVNTPFTMAPVLFLELSIGLACLGGGEAPGVTWRQLATWQGWKDAGVELRPFVAPLILGCVILGLVAAVIAYIAALTMIARSRRRVAPAIPLPVSPILPGPGAGGCAQGAGVRGVPAAPVVDTPENPS